MIGGRGPDRLDRELPSLPVDGNDRVRVLVRVDPDDHHVPVSPSLDGGATNEPADGQIPVRARPRSSQATPAGPSPSREPHDGQKPQRHKTLWSEPARPRHTDTGDSSPEPLVQA